MKLSIVLLVIVGVVAAGAAAVLLTTLGTHAPAMRAASPEVQIVVAARPLEAYTVVQADCVTSRKVPADSIPKGCLSDPAFVIGKALRVPLVSGQLFTSACFATDDSPQSVASRLLPAGKRAKTLSLSDDAAMQGLLYPGCTVDVLWCFSGNAAQGNPLAKVVLENIPVLAVGRQTALSGEEGITEALAHPVNTRTANLVTLLLDARQAEVLQLALNQGAISLVMRNPTDVALGAPKPMSLSALAGDIFPFASSDQFQTLLSSIHDLGKTLTEGLKNRAAVAAEATSSGQEWETVIIRGEKLDRAKFIVPAGQVVSATE